MKSTITITPIENIKNNAVVDNGKVTTETHNSLMDAFTFYNVVREEKRSSNLMNVSLYDDLIVREEGNYKILRMLSK